jgi:16S rRNA (adenine1518-N6/adenine1519-N6)-dimethyltransferase
MYFKIESWFDLAPGSFRPSPKVTSTVTVWNRTADRDPAPELAAKLRRCLEVCFRYRRQTLYNNLRRGLPGGDESAKEVLAISGLDGSDRAENLPPDSFVTLASVLKNELH